MNILEVYFLKKALYIIVVCVLAVVSAISIWKYLNLLDAPSEISSSSVIVDPASSTPKESFTQEPAQLLNISISAVSLQNNMIGESSEQFIGVCLPPGYADEETQYPVLYYLTGYTEDYLHRTEMFLNSMDNLYSNMLSEKMIIVVVNGSNRFGGSWYTNSEVTGNWENYVVLDVINYVDTNYRTIPNQKGRFLAGHSMGGVGAISIAMHRPEFFAAVYAMSPAVFAPEDFDAMGFSFDIINIVGSSYDGVDNEKAHEEYLSSIKNIPYEYWWTLSYASAFAPNAEGSPPYIETPKKTSSGKFSKDDVFEKYLQGAGNWETKVAEYAYELTALDCFAIDYGLYDENSWLPAGCRYFEEQLLNNGIPYELYTYPGGHNSHVNKRIETHVIPFFQRCLREE